MGQINSHKCYFAKTPRQIILSLAVNNRRLVGSITIVLTSGLIKAVLLYLVLVLVLKYIFRVLVLVLVLACKVLVLVLVLESFVLVLVLVTKYLLQRRKFWLCCWDAAGVATRQPKPKKNTFLIYIFEMHKLLLAYRVLTHRLDWWCFTTLCVWSSLVLTVRFYRAACNADAV